MEFMFGLRAMPRGTPNKTGQSHYQHECWTHDGVLARRTHVRHANPQTNLGTVCAVPVFWQQVFCYHCFAITDVTCGSILLFPTWSASMMAEDATNYVIQGFNWEQSCTLGINFTVAYTRTELVCNQVGPPVYINSLVFPSHQL